MSSTASEDRPSPVPPVTVILPTYNRSDTILACLAHLESQTWSDFDVIVVDDGSTDDTPAKLASYSQTTPLRLCLLRQENAGPARARNAAIRLASAPLCLIIGDDILATPDFVRTHLQFHREHPGLTEAAVGLTRWSETGQTVTPFMRWLDESGTQFSYSDLLRGVRPDWKHFYTSNLSVKTELLRRQPFNEQFNRATMEDMELGYRLQVEDGLKLTFLPQALAFHVHPTTFLKSCQRAYWVGRSVHLFTALWPEQQPPPRSPVRRSASAFFYRNAWLLPPLRSLTDRLTRFWCPNPLLAPVLAFYRGLGQRRAGSSTPPQAADPQ